MGRPRPARPHAPVIAGGDGHAAQPVAARCICSAGRRGARGKRPLDQYKKLRRFCGVADAAAEQRFRHQGRRVAARAGGTGGSKPWARADGRLDPVCAARTALSEGYATGGPTPARRQQRNSAEHPEKLVDSTYRAVHEMAVERKCRRERLYERAAVSGRISMDVPAAAATPSRARSAISTSTASSRRPRRGTRSGWCRAHRGDRLVNRSSTAHSGVKYPRPSHHELPCCSVRVGLDGVKDGVLENPDGWHVRSTEPRLQGRTRPLPDAPKVLSANGADVPTQGIPTGRGPVRRPSLAGSELEWDTLGGPEPLDNALSGPQHHLKEIQKWGKLASSTPRRCRDADRNDKAAASRTSPGPFSSEAASC